jgi:uncharacterized protein (TIGR02118 family)
MIQVSVMHPHKPGARFDRAYHLDKHMPMVKERMRSGLRFYAVDSGVAGGSLAIRQHTPSRRIR